MANDWWAKYKIYIEHEYNTKLYFIRTNVFTINDKGTICIIYDNDIIVLLRDVFHIGLVIGPRPAVLAWGTAERQYSKPRTYN